MGREGPSSEKSMTKKEIQQNKKAANTGPMIAVSKTSAKFQEFSSTSGQKMSGVKGQYDAKSDSFKDKPSYGLAPMDVEAIVGSTQTGQVKGGLTGVAGITTKNLGQLQQRATVGQLDMSIDTPLGKIPAGIGSLGLNVIGQKMANQIIKGISQGNQAVFDAKTNNIMGYVSKNALGASVYTGASAFNPLGRKNVQRVGTGYKLSAAEGPQGDGPQEVTSATDTTTPSATPTSGGSTGVSTGARRSMLASRQSGAARRLFIT